MQKDHPNGLPHLSAAKKPDGSVDHNQVLAGAAAWSKAIEDGEYTLTGVNEFALDDRNDCLIVHRRKN